MSEYQEYYGAKIVKKNWYKETCTHKGMTHVMTIGKAEIWAGSLHQSEMMEGQSSLWINLLGAKTRRKVAGVKLNAATSRILPSLHRYFKRRDAELILDWPDMQAPKYDLDFWECLVQDISNVEGKVVIHCMGGHGRTGTMLAIMAYLGNKCEGIDPVIWVRKHYCQSAVESSVQIKYLEKVIGIPRISSKASQPDRTDLLKPIVGFDMKDRLGW